MADHNLWDIIVNGDLEDEATPSGEQSSPPVPKTAKQLAARRNQERVKSILLFAIPDEYLLKFHNVPDAKSLWAAIKSRFGGNEESKKMQKNVLKHQFENFVTASNETLDKDYDRFLKLINIDEIDNDDLYNKLRVYEDELKRSLGSNSASQNLAFLSSENTGSTNEVSTVSGDFRVSTAGGINQVPSTLYAHDIAYSFLAQPTTSPQLENEDFQQMDGDDLEELDLRWQIAMLTVRVKKFIQRTGRNIDFKEKRPISIDKLKIEYYNCHRKGHFARECRSGRSQGRRSHGDNGRNNIPTNESSSQALVAQDGLGGYDWSNDFEVEPVNYALMAISSSSSSSSSDKLEKAVKERDELKDKIGKWEESTKNLEEILKSQMSARDKTYLGNFLTPRADISFAGLDEYAIRNKIIKSQTTEFNNKIDETAGKTNDAITEKPKSVSESVVSNHKINRDSVIIEDWTSDDEEEVFGVQKVRPETRDDKSGQNSHKQGVGFRKIMTSKHKHLLQGLPTEIYALVSQHRVAKDLWEKIKLLMQGTSLTKQELFQKGDDPIDAINHMMSFLTVVVTSPGRQTTYVAGTTRKYTPGASGSNTGKQRTVICYNCKGEGHIAKQCTKPKRKRDETWFNDKVLLVQAQASGQALTEEEIAFLADPGLPDIQTSSDTKIALMANLSRNGSDALTEVLNPDNLTYDLFNQSEQIMTSSEQSNDVSQSETEITEMASAENNTSGPVPQCLNDRLFTNSSGLDLIKLLL
ncbi:ribonuclease H-like domain-containing protein [Tanacetum coccineum]|uniref:Ribonuclease H-like domain-containing protein n=1 Tax=Tanacetum coccineum TaxID=301880 RepID=A0ABQ5B8R8_9ASTR